MPYTENDPKLPDNVKSLPDAKRRQWVNVWNSVYERCQAQGGDDCEAEAFRQANGVAIAKMITVNGLQISLEDIIAAMKKPGGGQREMLRQAQQARSKKYGIKIQPGGALTIPANLARMGAKDGDFADPVNYRYPVWLTVSAESITRAQLAQVRNAKARFEQYKNNYDQTSRAAVETRIDEAREKFGVGGVSKSWDCELFKQDAERQIAYGVALKASDRDNGLRPDTQRDVLSPESVEETAHRFMLDSRTFDLHHQETLSQKRAAVVESYLAPVDFQAGGVLVKKGDWIVAVKFFDPQLWADVKAGKIRAFSIKGVGKRSPLENNQLT